MSGSTCRSVSGAGGAAVEVPAEEAIGRHADLERRLRGVLDDGHAVLLGEGEDAEDAADAGHAVRVAGCACTPSRYARPRRSRAPGARGSTPACAPAGRRRGCWCHPRRARRCSRSSWPVFGREQPDVADHSTAPAPAGPASRAARRNTRPRLRRSHRDAPCARRSGSTETARAAAGPAPAAPPQTSRRPGASSCRGSACPPSAFPSDPDTPAPPRASRSAAPSAASSGRGPRRLRLCLSDPDRRRDTAARRRRSARARRDRAD